ncbi:MAG: PAS domain-containing protein [Cyanobacteria bacterium P01_H01_bin.152]
MALPLSKSTTHAAQVSPVMQDVLYQALDGAPTAIYVKDREQRLRFVNQACYRLVGQTPPALAAATETDLLSPAIAQRLEALDMNAWYGLEVTSPVTVVIPQSVEV